MRLVENDECPNCKNGTLEKVENELRCRGECGAIFKASACRSSLCQVDDCDGAHCPCCGGHKIGFYEPGMCDHCLLVCVLFPDNELGCVCKKCGKDSKGCEYCEECAKTLPEYDFAQDDQNFDAAREKGR